MALLAGLAGGLDSLGTSMQAKEKEQRRDQREIAKEDRNAERERIKAAADTLREENLARLKSRLGREDEEFKQAASYEFDKLRQETGVTRSAGRTGYSGHLGKDGKRWSFDRGTGQWTPSGGAGGVPDSAGAVPTASEVLGEQHGPGGDTTTVPVRKGDDKRAAGGTASPRDEATAKAGAGAAAADADAGTTDKGADKGSGTGAGKPARSPDEKVTLTIPKGDGEGGFSPRKIKITRRVREALSAAAKRGDERTMRTILRGNTQMNADDMAEFVRQQIREAARRAGRG